MEISGRNPRVKPNNEILSDIGCPFDKKGRHIYIQKEKGKGLMKKIWFECVCRRKA